MFFLKKKEKDQQERKYFYFFFKIITYVKDTWSFVNTRYVYNSASGAKPKQSLKLAITPATNVPWPTPSPNPGSSVQLERSFTFLKCGWFFLTPVSNTATLIPSPVYPAFHNLFASNAFVISPA